MNEYSIKNNYQRLLPFFFLFCVCFALNLHVCFGGFFYKVGQCKCVNMFRLLCDACHKNGIYQHGQLNKKYMQVVMHLVYKNNTHLPAAIHITLLSTIQDKKNFYTYKMGQHFGINVEYETHKTKPQWT